MKRLFPGTFRRTLLALVAVCLIPAMAGCRAKQHSEPSVLLDGSAWEGGSYSPESPDSLRVYVTWDGKALIDLPFGEVHSVTVKTPEGGENAVSLTGESVFMAHADCENQDCVQMGEVTRDNYEMRVMGGFIICLPHRVSVEVREK